MVQADTAPAFRDTEWADTVLLMTDTVWEATMEDILVAMEDTAMTEDTEGPMVTEHTGAIVVVTEDMELLMVATEVTAAAEATEASIPTTGIITPVIKAMATQATDITTNSPAMVTFIAAASLPA